MSIEDTNIVDLISMNGDKVVLTIADHLAWASDGDHLLKLQDKLNKYMSFIEGGEVFEQYPKARSKPVVIDVVFKFVPDEQGAIFLEKARNVIQSAGFEFECHIFQGSSSEISLMNFAENQKY